MPKKKDFILREKYFDQRKMRKLCIKHGLDPDKYYPKYGKNNENRNTNKRTKGNGKRNG